MNILQNIVDEKENCYRLQVLILSISIAFYGGCDMLIEVINLLKK